MRQYSWDILKFFAIYLVVWGHCIQQMRVPNVEEDMVYRMIYSFHMPLFMMISGYFSVSSMGMPIRAFFMKKFCHLIYPIIIWGFLLWLYFEIPSSFHYHAKEFTLKGMLIDFYWMADFWFLKSCFICYCLIYVGSRLGIRHIYWVTGTLLISQTISPFYVSFMYPCFVIGMELRLHSSVFKKIVSFYWVGLLVFFLMLCFWDVDAWNWSHGIPDGLLHADFSIWCNVAFSRFFRLSIGIIGALAFIALFSKLFKNDTNNCFLKDWGRYTLEIYIIQSVVLESLLGKSGVIRLNSINEYFLDWIITPCCASLFLIVSVGLVKVIYKSKFLGKSLFAKEV
jgi:fucose 4-O-acetylase-like acetyltransferase